jgi:hypothetical protein
MALCANAVRAFLNLIVIGPLEQARNQGRPYSETAMM